MTRLRARSAASPAGISAPRRGILPRCPAWEPRIPSTWRLKRYTKCHPRAGSGGMGGRMSRRTAIVADRRPLERGLARFLLEERGLFVVGEAATMADVLLQVQQLEPDLLVLHEKLALDHDPTVVAQIRRISARTSVVLLAASRDALPAELILLTDTVVEDGPGLTGLGTAVAGPTTEIDAASGTEPVDAKAIAVVPPARSAGSRWADRLQGLAVASIIALALVVARDMTTPTLVPTVVG